MDLTGKKIITFGEIMMRLSPPGYQRFTQARSFDVVYGGGEANVAASLANFGEPVDFISRIPNNPIGDACIQYLSQYGIGTSKIIRGGDRLGIYFLEMGAVQRGSLVIYDRAGSSISSIEPGMIDWDSAFADADWFHWTGITPAISRGTAEVCLEAAKVAKDKGLTVSCDLNYRAKLWKWGKKASEVMPELVSYCDIAIGNEEDAEKVFGIKAFGVDVTAGKLDAEKYNSVMDALKDRFPGLKTIAITLRTSISASHNTWSAVMLHSNDHYIGQSFDITHIVDRVGGGDAFMGGLIFGLRQFSDIPQQVLDFAIGASCLKHSVFGDFNQVSVSDVQKLISGDSSGRVSR